MFAYISFTLGLFLWVLCTDASRSFKITPIVDKDIVVETGGQNKSNFIAAINHGSCPITPFSFADALPGCLKLSGLISQSVDALKEGVRNTMDLTSVSEGNTADVNTKIMMPIADSLSGLIDEALSVSDEANFLQSNICAGNFQGDYDFAAYEGVCKNLPLNPEYRWTVFGFSVDIGVLSPFASPCTGATTEPSKFASFCMAMTKDCNFLPSFIFSVSPIIFKCQPFDTALAASSAGASKIVTETLSVAVESFTFGISITNSFVRTFTTYDGSNIIDFTPPGSLYSSGEFSISTDAIPNVPEFFSFGGEAVKMIAISGVTDGVNKAINELKKAPTEGPEKALTAVKKLVTTLDFALLYNIKLTLKFEFSQLGDLGSALPDSEEMEIGEASIYATTGTVTSGSNSLKPGMYMYTSGNIGNVLKEMLRYALSFVGEILNFIPDWLPDDLIDFDAKDLVDKMKTNGNGDDFAISFVTIAPDGEAILMLRAPLIIAELGYIKLRCSIDILKGKFKCSVETKFASKLFAAVGKALDDAVVWVAKELEDIGQDFEDAGKVLAAGLSTVGDALDKFGSAFSINTISQTLSMLEDGELNLDELDDIGYEIASWGLEQGGKLLDVFDDIKDGLADGVQEAAEFGEGLVNSISNEFASAEIDLNTAAQILAPLLGCSKNNVKNAVQKVCKSCCLPAYNLEKELEAFGNNIENAVESVVKQVSQWFEKGFNDFLETIGLSSTSTSISKKATGKKDPLSYCPTYEFTEKRTKTVGIWPFKKKKTTYHNLFIAPLEPCVKKHLELTENVQLKQNGLMVSRMNFQS